MYNVDYSKNFTTYYVEHCMTISVYIAASKQSISKLEIAVEKSSENKVRGDRHGKIRCNQSLHQPINLYQQSKHRKLLT